MATQDQENPTKPLLSSPTSTLPPKKSCAACKHRRQRCPPDCPLAPYFPADKQREFHNVHRLFGVNYVVTLLKAVQPHHRDDAVKSIIYEANCRAANPVGGCYAAIRHLYKQIQLCQAELQMVSKKLAFHKARFHPYINARAYDYNYKPPYSTHP